ncbi:N-acetylgalactosamine kinase isoform X6 [Columba livia]|uniref:N-acetylgalactosamine kinase isoform X6 n=1 Tax=Columba livia TaxID=8932 RepID=UPI0031BAF835
MATDAPSTLRVQLVEQPRLQKLKEMFLSKFGTAPEFYVRAPGRVNLIGEHIDYCGYAVLPMAIEQDILIAVKPVKSQVVQLANTDSSYLDFSTNVNNVQINKTKPQWHNYFLCGLKGIQVELAEICTKSERYIGTEGGGMDQSISFLAEEGTLLAKSKGLDWKDMSRLHDVQSGLGVSLADMLTVVEAVLHPEPYSTEEISKCLGISLEELRSQGLSQNTQDVSTFKLYQRAKHVYSEAARVLEFKKICNEAPADAIQLLGELMNQSHISCREMYECSCPELDRLVDICLQFGATGSRLTGAGWGGCTVSMVPTDKLNTFMKNVGKAYYQTNVQRLALENNSLFATKPGSGALVFVEA